VSGVTGVSGTSGFGVGFGFIGDTGKGTPTDKFPDVFIDTAGILGIRDNVAALFAVGAVPKLVFITLLYPARPVAVAASDAYTNAHIATETVENPNNLDMNDIKIPPYYLFYYAIKKNLIKVFFA
jgi:hypothetical protein